MLKKLSYPFIGFLQASGLFAYILAVTSLINYLGSRFNNSNGIFYGPMIFLMLFIISAVISATLVLGKAGILFWNKKYKESFTLLGWTIGWCLFFFAFLMLLILK